MFLNTFGKILILLPALVSASPVALYERADVITTLTTSQISAFKPYTLYTAVSYCTPALTLAWNCGAKCDANPTFVTSASGGDSGAIQYWYVGYDSALNTVIVGNQGTDTSNILADLTDADFFLGGLDSTLFPGLSSSILVHSGFRDSHARSAPSILAAVISTLNAHPGASVTSVGHSLGAAHALLDAVYLPLHLPSGTKFKTVAYGMPRVGNQEFADYVDATVTDLTHINNKQDPVPILPGRDLGFHHPRGEVHIQNSSSWDACPGQDNTDSKCTVGDVPSLLESDANDHHGPYDSIFMGCTDTS